MRSVVALIAPRRRRVLLCCATTLLVLSGCAAGAGGGPAVSRTVVGVTERDFHIAATVAKVSAGDLTLRVHNAGPDEHELIVAPDRTGGMPLRSDGFTVNEEAIQSSEPGSITPQQPGGTELLTVHLRPGRYVLFCNMEGHFMAGMQRMLVVR